MEKIIVKVLCNQINNAIYTDNIIIKSHEFHSSNTATPCILQQRERAAERGSELRLL